MPRSMWLPILGLAVASALPGCRRDRPPWQPLFCRLAGPDAQPADTWESDADGFGWPAEHLTGSQSRIVVHGLFHAPLLGALLLAALLADQHRRRARAWRALDLRAPLRAGPIAVVGRVEVDEQVPWVIQVRLRQTGREWQNKGSWSHTWKQVERSVHTSPFYLRRDDGERIRVEPDMSMRFEGPLDRTEVESATERTRLSELKPGAEVLVCGVLRHTTDAHVRDGYRGVPSEATLQGSKTRPLTISSSELGADDDRRASFHRKALIALAAVFLLGVSILVGQFELLSLDGHVEAVVPTGRQHWMEWYKPKNSRGRWVHHQAVGGHIQLDGVALAVTDECSPRLYDEVARLPCHPVSFIVSRHFPTIHNLGAAPTISNTRAVLATMTSLGAVIVYFVAYLQSRPWHERRRFHESGAGRLPYVAARSVSKRGPSR